jgi:hypothetical protein
MQLILLQCSFIPENLIYYKIKYICNNFIFIAVNKFLLKSSFFRNVLKKSAPHLTGPSPLYTIGGDQCMKKLALGH